MKYIYFIGLFIYLRVSCLFVTGVAMVTKHRMRKNPLLNMLEMLDFEWHMK